MSDERYEWDCCVECGGDGRRRICMGDGRVHHHGGAHTIGSKLGLLCDHCYQQDTAAWHERKGTEHCFCGTCSGARLTPATS